MTYEGVGEKGPTKIAGAAETATAIASATATASARSNGSLINNKHEQSRIGVGGTAVGAVGVVRARRSAITERRRAQIERMLGKSLQLRAKGRQRQQQQLQESYETAIVECDTAPRNNNTKENCKTQNKGDNNNEKCDQSSKTVNSEIESRSVVVAGPVREVFEARALEAEEEGAVGGDVTAIGPSSSNRSSGGGGGLAQRRIATLDATPEEEDNLHAEGNYHSYENLNYDLPLTKKYLLQRYFRSGLDSSSLPPSQQLPPQQRPSQSATGEYENLCRSCGYGVFGARGPLCHFCACLLHGLRPAEAGGETTTSATPSESGTVYENVCGRCGRITNGEGCECEQPVTLDAVPEKSSSKKPKREKRGLFHGLIGSLKRAHKGRGSGSRRPRIEHNVDGYENVFSTRATFDLQHIVQLKRGEPSSVSASDQHIYGRLKRPETPQAARQAASTDALCAPASASTSAAELETGPSAEGEQEAEPAPQWKGKHKRKRLSSTRLLFGSLHKPPRGKSGAPPPLPPKGPSDKKPLYLRGSVCTWMTSVRVEVHSYPDEDVGTCRPKSVPPKHSQSLHSHRYRYCPRDAVLAPDPLTKFVNIEPVRGGSSGSSGSSSYGGSAVTLRRPVSQSHQFYEELGDEGDPWPSPAERLVREFKCNLLARQTMQQPSSLASAQLRSKRRAIYLKPSDDQSKRLNNTTSDSDSPSSDAAAAATATAARDVNRARAQRTNDNSDRNNSPTASQFDEAENSASTSLASRRTASQGFTSNKRCGIYERDSEFVNDILSAFETFLQRDTNGEVATEARAEAESEGSGEAADREQPILPADPVGPISGAAESSGEEPIDRSQWLQQVVPVRRAESSRHVAFDLLQLIEHQLLSLGLNRVVIGGVDPPLRAFLSRISADRRAGGAGCASWDEERLVRNFRHFNTAWRRGVAESSSRSDSEQQKSALSVVPASDAIVATSSDRQAVELASVESSPEPKPTDDEDLPMGEATKSSESECLESVHSKSDSAGAKFSPRPPQVPKLASLQKALASVRVRPKVDRPTAVADESARPKEVRLRSNRSSPSDLSRSNGPKPPQVPARDPRTALSGAAASPPLPSKRTSPATPSAGGTMPTYDNAHLTKRMGHVCVDDDDGDGDDAGDEESIYQPIWKFTTVGEVPERYHTDADYYEIGGSGACASAKDGAESLAACVAGSVDDHGEWETDDEFMFATQLDSSTLRSTGSTGSTITGFGSSTATLPSSAVSVSLTHHLLRSVGVFYSPTNPKLRAIVYEYDRVLASTYFARQPPASASTAAPVGPVDNGPPPLSAERSPVPPPRTSSAASTKGAPPVGGGESGCRSAKVAAPAAKLHLLPDSVQAWKFMLLDVHYLEDEEDMIVSETAILHSQQLREDVDNRQTQQLSILQRFKSASIGNLIDLPNEDDKKSIAERMRNKLQRGVFKLNVRSPKSEKKSRGIFRRTEATSLYLEDGMKPKYPIFGATLEQLELNQTTHPNVPRFVVDCVEYIERRECISQDGLYRASGNKVSIDELKQKLSESYIYDPKLLAADDIHTLTSLLKLFFRELAAPLIPQETYERLAPTLTDAAGIESLQVAFETMREPNLPTLKFLIKHLTNVAAYSGENRMPASNLAIVWGPCILSVNQIEFDIGRMNTLAKVLIENYEHIFGEQERLVS